MVSFLIINSETELLKDTYHSFVECSFDLRDIF